MCIRKGISFFHISGDRLNCATRGKMLILSSFTRLYENPSYPMRVPRACFVYVEIRITQCSRRSYNGKGSVRELDAFNRKGKYLALEIDRERRCLLFANKKAVLCGVVPFVLYIYNNNNNYVRSNQYK
uniref:Uncharacterized protein n=1 Tax=Picea glauca TaxID=3330 RepID=A0A124GND6_PICGL|nr:hypothetical protein ABT39_MTgene4501 [Picea glauca]QHR87412.1 hypothetical protein Q903MT_gene1422 [Picea sitchensis]